MDQKYASLGRRIIGGLIDIVLVAAFFYSYIMLFGQKVGPGEYSVTGLTASILFLTIFLYFTVLEKLAGKTLGKLIARTKVVNANGMKISWGQSIVRNLIRPIDAAFIGIVAIIAIASTEKKQRLGDLLAKTYVVTD